MTGSTLSRPDEWEAACFTPNFSLIIVIAATGVVEGRGEVLSPCCNGGSPAVLRDGGSQRVRKGVLSRAVAGAWAASG